MGIPAYMLIGMQTDYNIQVVSRDKSFKERLEQIRKAVAIL
jgi:hypothetical protein